MVASSSSLAPEENQRRFVESLDGDAAVSLLNPTGEPIPDPYSTDLDFYLFVYEMIRRALEVRLAALT